MWGDFFRFSRLKLGALLFWAALLALFVWLRWPSSPDRILNSDEQIPLGMSAAMTRIGVLDPNWDFMTEPAAFSSPQYNFYLYNVLAHFVVRIAAHLNLDSLAALRFANIPLQAAALALLAWSAWRFRLGAAAIAAIALLMTTAPTFVNDALMARPESLLYLLTAAGIAAAAAPWSERFKALGVGLACGLGAAVKITFPVVALAAALAHLFFGKPTLKTLFTLGLFFALGLALGYAIGAPLAIVNWQVTLHGIAALGDQYESAHGTHSLIEHSFLPQLLWILRFFGELYWPWALLVGAGVALGSKVERLAILALMAPVLLLVVYFATAAVFFERNFAHAMPFFLMASGVGCSAVARRIHNKYVTAIGVLLLCASGLYWSVQIGRTARDSGASIARFEAAHELDSFQEVPIPRIRRARLPLCGRIEVRSFNDERSLRYIGLARQSGFSEIAHFRGPFSHLAPSTFQVYLADDRYYFEKSCGTPLDIESEALAPSWREGGQPNSLGASPVPGRVFGSFASEGDAGVGVASVQYRVPQGARQFGLVVAVGAASQRQHLRITTPGGETLADIALADVGAGWRIVGLPRPSTGFPPIIIVEARDEGDGRGEWMAFGAVHARTR